MTEVYPAKATDFQPDPHNANAGTERGQYAVETSIEKFGLGRSIVVSRDGVVIAGNKTLQAAIDAGLIEARVIETDGHELVVVKRTDIESGSKEAVELGIADNRTSEVGLEWNVDELQWAVEEMEIELEDWFWESELEDIGIIIPGFEPTDGSEQPRLDRKSSIICPQCGHEFVPK